MEFPSLTGKKRPARGEEQRSTTLYASELSVADISRVTASVDALPFSVLQAAWSVILSAYVGAQDNVIFGTIFTFPNDQLNRITKDPEHVIIPTEASLFKHGDCVSATIGDVLKQLTQSTDHKARSKLQALQHSTNLDQWSGNGTAVAFDNEDSSGIRRRTNRKTFENNSFALSISAFPSIDGSLALQANYTELVLDEASALVVLAQLDDVITYIISNLSKPFYSSRTAVRPSLLSISNQDVPEVNGFHADAPLLHSQFENVAKENPELLALEFWYDIHAEDFTRLTYGELNARADAFARYLNHHYGQLSDQPVPICMDRCPELYIAILGILKAGGAWCPVDASFPARRRHDLIIRTGSRIMIIADQDLASKTDGIPQGVVAVDITKVDTRGRQQIDLPGVQMGSLAYLIWTSGTTGAPKGVPIQHEAALTSMRALQRSIPIDVNGDVVRCMQFSHFTFDVFVQDLFYTWGVGGSIISSTRSIMLGSFADLANKARATHAHLTPAFAASVPRQRCVTLEVITMIGEKLTQAVADNWGHNMRAYNTYGPAETTVVSTSRQFGSVEDEIRSENVGYPLPSVSAFVVRDGYPLMRHGVGELALGGPQLSKGYWNDPEKTAGRFVWNTQFSRILYMTGDMVRQLHDGSLVFVGREDDLIKIQGIRVELSEISFGLRACHPLVEQIEIQYLERPDRPSKVIIAFLAVPSLEATDAGLIRNGKAAAIAKTALLQAKQTLADYMIPRVFLVIHSIPKTTSNKIDRNKLKDFYSSIDLGSWEKALATDHSGTIEEAEWNQTNMEIIAVGAELSGTSRDSLSRHTDLRSIGIDSIAATRLAPMLNARGFSISIADILQCQKLDDIVNRLEKSDTRRPRFDLEDFHEKWYDRVRKKLQRDDFVVLPSLPLQESLLSESMQNAKAYWSNTFLSLDAQIDLTRLKEAWVQVVNNTDALRTGFIPTAAVADGIETTRNTFLQLIYNTADLDWTIFESSDAAFKGLAIEQAQRVANRYQGQTFINAPIAITVFVQPKERTMMMTIHHSIRDEPSLDFLLEDLWTAYTHGNSKRRHQSRKATGLLYPTDTQIQRDERYWSEVLSEFSTTEDEDAFPDLSGDPTKRDENFITHIQQLTTPYKALQDAAVSLGATSAASILRVAWGCILLMYLETESTVFAETWSDRVEDPLLEDIVGPLTSVLPVPFRATGSARETLMAQTHIQRDSRAHRSIHGRAIRKLLQRPKHRSVYPALFNFLPEASKATPDKQPPAWRKIENLIALTVEHPLALNVTPLASGRVELELIASSQVISGAHLAILAQQVDAVVAAMLADPDIPLARIPSYLPAHLISKTSVGFSEEVKAASKQDPLDWVDHYARDQPSWPAAMFFSAIDETQSECWTYAELQSAYRRVASFIGGHGFHHEMIAVCLDRRLEAYAVVLGILASGNTYLPIDEDLPDERKSFLIKDSHAVMLFTISTLASTFTNTEVRVVVVVNNDSYTDMMSNGHPVQPEALSDPHDDAYLLYTSGSTGVPKGVLVGRGNLCSFIEGLSEYIQPRIPGMKDAQGKGRYLGLASRAFDVHLSEMFLAWRRGLAAVTAPRTLLLDDLESALRILKITHASFVPSLIDQVGLDPANLPDLHYLGVGGEKMSKRTVDAWAASKNAALVNLYGPTEMSIGCTAAEVTSGSNLKNIGRPYGNSVAHVLVPGSNEYTLRGVAGELCFTGDLVANGYYNRPDAKGFVEDFHGERMYRTGDIVRLMADDTLEYLRREDDQTKVRGQRLELGEISETIRSSVTMALTADKIEVATIVAQHPKLPRPQLVSFVVTQSGETESTEILRSLQDHQMADSIMDHCQKVLPSYLVPDVVLPLSRLPLAPASGKADQKRLKSLFADAPIEDLINRSVDGKIEQREFTASEQIIKNAVTSTLAVDGADIFPTTNIFRLGLESLSAINLAVRMQKLGYDCTVSAVLNNPTVEKLALLSQGKAEQAQRTYSPLAALKARYLESHPKHSSRIVKPCLPLQETLVASSLNDPERALYVNNVVLRLSTTTDMTRLGKAIMQVMADHDILRTCFPAFESGFVQVICEPPSIPWEEVTVTDLDAAIQEMQDTPPIDIVKQICEKPPLKLTLFRQTANERSPVLLFQIHHALYDGESFAMVLQDIDKRYHSAAMPAHTPFDSLLEYILCQDREEARSFWQHYLRDFEQTCAMDHDASSENLTTDRVLTTSIAELEDFSASISGTLTSTVQAAFGIVLAQIFETHDVVFGAVLSGRTVPIESPNTIVAPCLTTIPQRVNVGTESSNIVDIMKVATEAFAESLTFQHVALRDIHRWLEMDRPLFDCLVTYVQKKSQFVSDLWTELEGSMANDFPLAVEFEADHETGQMRAHCAFTSAFGDIGKAAYLLENIDLLLGALARGETVTTHDLGTSKGTGLKPSPKTWDGLEWSPMEMQIRDVAGEMSGISPQDINKGSSFFSLGIDSITAIRFAKRLRQREIDCSSADVMQHPCIGALAQHIGASQQQVNGVKVPDIDMPELIAGIPLLGHGDAVTDVYQCTPLQSSMLTQTLGSEGSLYAHHHALRLSETIDLPGLKQAWGRLIAQTEILRTTFHFAPESGLWMAAVHKDCPTLWTEVESMNTVTQTFAFHNEASFEHPPWKTTILRRPNEILLVISKHHSLYDGISISLLIQDLAHLYNGFELHPKSPFSEAARVISQSTQDAENFWLQKLDRYQGSQHISENSDSGITSLDHTLDMNVENVLQGCKDLGVTLQTVALLAHAKSLACLSGQRDVVFGHVVGGRSIAIPDADDIVGPMFNTIPSRITLDKTFVSNKSMAKDIQQSSGDAQAHQHASLARVQQTWRQRAPRSDRQLFDSVFVFVNSASPSSSIDSLGTLVDIGGAVDPTEYSLNVEIEQARDKITLRANARMNEKRLRDWVNTFEDTLRDILEHPDRSVLAFPPSLQSIPLHVKNDTNPAPARVNIEPGTDLDAIREALSTVSKIPSKKISSDVSIFSLGLDSIAAIRVAATCRQKGYAISVADVLQGRSLEGICRRLRERTCDKVPDLPNQNINTLVSNDTKAKALAVLDVKEEEVEQVSPCLAGQVFHLASWLKTNRTTCEAVFTYRSSLDLDIRSLRSAWMKLCNRHPILRTAFVATSPDEVVQVVLQPSTLKDDLFSSANSDAAIHNLIQQEAAEHFTLFLPPTKLHHIHQNNQDLILLKLHHATYDAWTIPTLISDLAALYQDINFPRPQSFAPFTDHTLKTLQSSQQQAYWRKSLANAQPTLLTPPATETPSPSAGSILISFPSAISSLSTVAQKCQSTSLSLPTLILTAFARTLARHTASTNPLFGLYQVGRSAAFDGVEKLCAPCLNITPVCVPFALSVSIEESAHRLQEDMAERVAWEQSFLKDVLWFAGLRTEESGREGPVFNAFVNILSSPPDGRLGDGKEKLDKDLFMPYHLSHAEAASLYTSSPSLNESDPGSTQINKNSSRAKTAIDNLDTTYLSDKNFYLDVMRKDEDNAIDFAVKCEGGLMHDDGVRAFVMEVVAEVDGFVGGEREDGKIVGDGKDGVVGAGNKADVVN